jgi:hypothetical protein
MKKCLNSMPTNWPIGVVAGAAISVLFGYIAGMAWQNMAVSAAISSIITFVTIFLLSRHDASLAARATGDTPFTWDIWMNGCKVGEINDVKYAQIQRSAFGNGNVVIAQMLNLGRVALNIVGKGLVDVPLLMFWLCVIFSIAAPESMGDVAAAWRAADLVSIMQIFHSLLNMAVIFYIVSIGVMFFLGYRFGFRNSYAEVVERTIRQELNIPYEGDLHLSKTPALVAEAYN